VSSSKPDNRLRPARAAALASASVLVVAGLSACNTDRDGDEALGNPFSDGSSSSPAGPQVQVQANVTRRKSVPVDKLVKLTAAKGSLTDVVVRTANGRTRIPGDLSDDGSSWQASSRLEPGTTYRIKATAEDADGQTLQFARTFSTDDLSLDQQTYPSLLPADGDTVGVAMPVILRFDVPVTDKARFEKHLTVTTTPVQKGSWHWISDNEVHWRPKAYWRPGTKVDVDADINSVAAGNGVFGQEDRSTSFTIGDAVVMRVDVAAHQMKVLRNGTLLRTIPISAGKPGFTTRSGTKVIVEKFRYKRMNAATTGISEDDPEYYDLENVEYAQRVTYSGEFIHAAPWSVGSQGYANVSHGCVGMSTSNAGWLYGLTKIGDPVEVTGTDRHMDLTNGYGDWNVSYREYRLGSALG